ncbi:glycosyltransferase [Candidatus Clostridium stratigraminis]|uniref:Glycosyltransferase n=1 Tax=Candidatus Clostridium stratigraminis TaxID=3381661 RepID=A0ABW8T1H2_9CLOT
MSVSFKVWTIIAALLIYSCVMVICRLIILKLKDKKSNNFTKEQKNIFFKYDKNIKFKNKTSVDSYLEMKNAIKLDKDNTENIEKHFDISKAEKRYIKGLTSIFKTKRIQSAAFLGMIGTEKARLALEKYLVKEKDSTIKLYMANSLSDIGNKESIPVLADSLIDSHRFYRDKVNMLISDFGEAFNSYVPKLSKSNKIEIKELIVDFSSVYFSVYVKEYLLELINNMNSEIKAFQDLYDNYKSKGEKMPPVSINIEENYRKLVYKACNNLAKYYPKVLTEDMYLYSEDVEIRNIAVRALSSFNSIENLDRLIGFLRDEYTSRSAVNSISLIIVRNPGYINRVVMAFQEERDRLVKKELAKILSGRIEYFIMKLTSKSNVDAKEIIKEILLLGRTSEVINFLNKNKNVDIENELIAIIKEVIPKGLEKDFSMYLKEKLARKCGITPFHEAVPKNIEHRDKKLIRNLYVLLILCILISPVIYSIRHRDILFTLPIIEQVKLFIIDFNYYLAYYSLAISIIYLGLLVLSYLSSKRQVKLWRIKSRSLLFKKRILPAVSIIAPAYDEEKTIIESSNSLLNLKYPDYELILVNDGSKDNTLEVLINYYNLTRVDYIFDYKLNTKPIRGVYMNSSMPKLIVVDKEKGGKADSLNAGINISTKEYYCGIDADSLLEDEALLKLASLTLDEGIETPALGGNIFPINGCTIVQGQIKNIRIPKNKIAKFQTVEYIRAFMTGRLGWADLNSLLIISGAFGLFRKERVVSVGGYLTSSGKYEKDTVGEDMELVVRISRLMRELKLKYRICYSFNANCWTEVPEDIKTLKKQRYRWHKGLIDILTFHKKMLFNPGYGRTGILALPYFFIFELLGPIFELEGYIMVVFAVIFGLLNVQIALILFTSTVLMGVLISVSSLIIAETDIKYFSLKDVFILIGYAVIENFGPRQVVSFWRVGAYFNMFKNSQAWDKSERKGFEGINTSAKV